MFCSDLRGKRYRFLAKRLPTKQYGGCEPPDKPNKSINISKSIRSPQLLLETILHESLHGCLWDLDEQAISQTAECITRVLIKAGITVDVDEVYGRLKQENQ